MNCKTRLLTLLCLPLLAAATANATIIVSTSTDLQGCGGFGYPPCPPPPVSTFNGGLIKNGDFGNGNFSYFSGTVTTNSDKTQAGVIGNANQSSSYAYLASAGSDQTLSQTVATTPGDTYTISFNLANYVGSQTSLSPTYDFAASFGNQLLLSFSDPNSPVNYMGATFTFNAVADSASTTLLFSARNDPGAFGLTAISVKDSTTHLQNDLVAVTPEPQSLMLLGTGVLGLVGVARRRVRS